MFRFIIESIIGMLCLTSIPIVVGCFSKKLANYTLCIYYFAAMVVFACIKIKASGVNIIPYEETAIMSMFGVLPCYLIVTLIIDKIKKKLEKRVFDEEDIWVKF